MQAQIRHEHESDRRDFQIMARAALSERLLSMYTADGEKLTTEQFDRAASIATLLLQSLTEGKQLPLDEDFIDAIEPALDIMKTFNPRLVEPNFDLLEINKSLSLQGSPLEQFETLLDLMADYAQGQSVSSIINVLYPRNSRGYYFLSGMFVTLGFTVESTCEKN
jgi:hypothetical protein